MRVWDRLLAAGGFGVAASLSIAWAISTPAFGVVSQAAAVAAPLRIDLDHFDAMKKTIPPSNGLTLGYVELSDPKGKPVRFIHGYTDRARDWEPLVPYLPKSLREPQGVAAVVNPFLLNGN